MSKVASNPELKKYMNLRVFTHLVGNRKVSGVLRGHDIFLNLVLDDATDESTAGLKIPAGQVVIRGNSVISIETLEAATGVISIGGYPQPGQGTARL